MKKLFVLLALVLTLLVGTLAVGCNDTVAYKSAESGVTTSQEEASESLIFTESGRKIVYNIELNLSSKDIAETEKNIKTKLEEIGGWVDNSHENHSGGELYYVNITVRVPTEKLDEYLDIISEDEVVLNKTVQSTDITDSYLNAEAKKTALLEEKQRLNDLLSSVTDVSDALKINKEISLIDEQLERLSRFTDSYDSLAEYSVVTITVNQYYEDDAFMDLSIFFIVLIMAIAFFILPLIIIVLAILLAQSKKKLKKLTANNENKPNETK